MGAVSTSTLFQNNCIVNNNRVFQIPEIAVKRNPSVCHYSIDEVLEECDVPQSMYVPKRNDVIEFPILEDMVFCSKQRKQNEPDKDFFVAVLVNGEPQWLRLDIRMLLTCLSSAGAITVL